MKKLILISVFVILTSELSAQCDEVFSYSDTAFEVGSIRHLDLNFDFNGGRVIKDSLGLIELKQLADFLRNHPSLKFDIEHHCDSRGSEAYNQKLSEHRAERLVNELIFNYSIDSTQIRPVGYGELRPLIQLTYQNQMNLHLKDEYLREGVHAMNRRSILKIREILK